MTRILLCHDGTAISENVAHFLHKELKSSSTLDILYLIPQNLIHYGEVDQLATPDSKQEFIQYVQELGINECKEKLEPFVAEIKNFAVKQGLTLNVQLHVRWGNAINAIQEVVKYYNCEAVIIPNKIWGLDWNMQQNLSSSWNLHPQALHIF